MRFKFYRTLIYLFFAALIFIFGQFPEWVEKYYSNLLYPLIATIQRSISSIFPFAIGDFLYAILVILVVCQLIIFIGEKNKHKLAYQRFGLSVLNALLLIYISFKLLWGLNYNRPAINEQLQISNQHYQKDELLKLNAFMLKKLELLSTSRSERATNLPTLSDLSDQATAAYADLANAQPFFTYKKPSVKRVISTWLTSKTGIEGYFNPLSGEANVNTILPAFVLPFTVCHEIAHQLGVAKEDEANLVGYLAAIKSTDPQFQYSAYYNMLQYVLFEIRMKYPEDYNLIITQVPENIKQDFKTEREFWAKYNGPMADYMSNTFDQILKLNNQEKGIESYQDIVLWLYNYHIKEL